MKSTLKDLKTGWKNVEWVVEYETLPNSEYKFIWKSDAGVDKVKTVEKKKPSYSDFFCYITQ